jgi:SAM-dependent methyltransferase
VQAKVSVLFVQIPSGEARDVVTRLNLGCGRDAMPGWTNVDSARLPGVDVVADLDRCAETRLPFEADSVDQFLLSHVIEHLHAPLPLMQELWRIAKPGAKLTILTPYGHSDDAWEDPTHVRPYFINSFAFFAQPNYWRADYGYRGDWQPDHIVLKVKRAANEGLTVDQVMDKIMSQRNVVREMMVELSAVKPMRAAKAELRQRPRIDIALVG